MCARFSLYATPDQIAQLLDLEAPDFLPRYNIAPTQMVLGAVERNGGRELREFRWGLIPSWAKDVKIGNKMINARSETVMSNGSFRAALQKRRCIIPASGFFEWRHDTPEPNPVAPSLFGEFDGPIHGKKPKTVKHPFLITMKSGKPFGLAGLYEYWRDPKGELIRSCTILTTRPNEVIEPLHDRMPVIIQKEDIEAWINCDDTDLDQLQQLFEPTHGSDMMAEPVSSAVNNPNNETPEVLAPA